MSLPSLVRCSALVLAAGFLAGSAPAQITVVNGASFEHHTALSPGSIASVFGENLCATTATATFVGPGELPTVLDACSVDVGGSAAMLLYISPAQINFVVPAGLVPGNTNITVHDGSQTQTGSIQISRGSPGIFAFNGMGVGPGAILHAQTFHPGPFSVTTGSNPTQVAIFVTGLDLSAPPQVLVGGVPAEVTFYGPAPGYVGLQQINVIVPASAAGAGRVPVVIFSGGSTSNVIEMDLLPTDKMMHGMPGWNDNNHVQENHRRDREVSHMALNATNHTLLVSDHNDDALRIISLDSSATLSTISLPKNSDAGNVAVSDDGSMAAVSFPNEASVGLVDLKTLTLVAVVGTGHFPTGLAFAGTNLLVTNHASGTVSVIDTGSRDVIQTVAVDDGPNAIAVDAANNRAFVANLQSGTASQIDLTNWSVKSFSLPATVRPMAIAYSSAVSRVVIASPLNDSVILLNPADGSTVSIDVGAFGGKGPGALAVNGSKAYVANMASSSVTELDLAGHAPLRNITVDPGPRSLAVDAGRNQLIALAQGTGTIDVVDLGSGNIVLRISGVEGEPQTPFQLPTIASFTPDSAKAGSTFTLTINGANLSGISRIEFMIPRGTSGMGGGMMGGGKAHSDDGITVSNLAVDPAGTQITATVQIDQSDPPGARFVHLESSDDGMPMELTFTLLQFTVLAP